MKIMILILFISLHIVTKSDAQSVFNSSCYTFKNQTFLSLFKVDNAGLVTVSGSRAHIYIANDTDEHYVGRRLSVDKYKFINETCCKQFRVLYDTGMPALSGYFDDNENDIIYPNETWSPGTYFEKFDQYKPLVVLCAPTDFGIPQNLNLKLLLTFAENTPALKALGSRLTSLSVAALRNSYMTNDGRILFEYRILNEDDDRCVSIEKYEFSVFTKAFKYDSGFSYCEGYP